LDPGLVAHRPSIWRYQVDVRDALAAYQQVAGTGRGQVLLVACPPCGGAGGVLQGLAELLGQADRRPTVVGGSFADGEYAPWPRPNRRRVSAEKLAGVVSKVVEVGAPAVTAAVGGAVACLGRQAGRAARRDERGGSGAG
jgi:hypothetical protein